MIERTSFELNDTRIEDHGTLVVGKELSSYRESKEAKTFVWNFTGVSVQVLKEQTKKYSKEVTKS
ncbi:unnamed protein product [Amoebophrya sp. A25]|nr:unnamed protein product [Amoebophrya sp. A25]|eukprot:GSA25T00003872001.1